MQPLDLGRQALADAVAAGAPRALERALERAVCAPSSTSCANVVATGHTVRGSFLTLWDSGETARWFGLPLTETFAAPDRTRIQYFENGILRLTAGGAVEPLPLGSIAARQAQVDTKPIDRPQDVPTYDETLFVPPPKATPVEETGSGTEWSFGPGPQQGAWKEIVVSISAQSVWAYEEGQLVMSSLVSTGTAEVWETTTPSAVERAVQVRRAGHGRHYQRRDYFVAESPTSCTSTTVVEIHDVGTSSTNSIVADGPFHVLRVVLGRARSDSRRESSFGTRRCRC